MEPSKAKGIFRFFRFLKFTANSKRKKIVISQKFMYFCKPF